MTKTRINAMLMAALVVFFTSCSEKEVPQPVEDTARIDALRQELRELQVKIHGEQTTNKLLDMENDVLTVNADSLQAIVNQLEEQYNATVSYQVTAVDLNGNTISGATVTLNQNGAIEDGTTADDGTVTFAGVKSGYIVGVVKADGYATANFTTTLYNNQEGRANTKVAILPKSADALAKNGSVKISGFLYANFNVTDDTTGGVHRLYSPWTGYTEWTNIDSYAGTDEATSEEGPNWWAIHRTYEPVKTKFTLHPDIELNQVPFSTEYFDSFTAGTLQQVTYEDAVYEATFADNGKYTFEIPIYGRDLENASSIDFYFYADEFTHDVTLVNNGSTFSDGAPMTVDNPKPTTYTENRIFRFDYNWSNYQYDNYVNNGWDYSTSEDGWDFYYSEGARN